MIVFVVVAGLSGCSTRDASVVRPPAVATPPADVLAALDTRTPVPLLPRMALHQKENMRDHLLVVQQITDGLARDDWAAIEAAAGRFASSPEMQMQCEHMGMGADGFHHRADGIVTAAKEKDAAKVLAATARTLEACTTCHATYRQDVVTDAAWSERTGSAAPSMHP